MSPRKPRLTFDEHNQLGERLYRLNGEFREILLQLGIAYPLNDPINLKVKKVMKEISKLRSLLDDQIGVDCPDQSYQDLNRAYYPRHRLED